MSASGLAACVWGAGKKPSTLFRHPSIGREWQSVSRTRTPTLLNRDGNLSYVASTRDPGSY